VLLLHAKIKFISSSAQYFYVEKLMIRINLLVVMLEVLLNVFADNMLVGSWRYNDKIFSVKNLLTFFYVLNLNTSFIGDPSFKVMMLWR
jgi:hypothetical protein